MRQLLAAAAVVISLGSVAHADDLVAVRIKAPQVVGPTGAPLVERMLRRHRVRLDHCYQLSRRREPGLRGTLRAQFVVLASGELSHIRVEGVDNALENCAARQLRAVRFPAAAAETQVRVAIVLRPPPAPKPVPAATLQGILGAGQGQCLCPCNFGLGTNAGGLGD